VRLHGLGGVVTYLVVTLAGLGVAVRAARHRPSVAAAQAC
jgi:hypothetical protein